MFETGQPARFGTFKIRILDLFRISSFGFWIFVAISLLVVFSTEAAIGADAPVRFAMWGLSHDHAAGFLPRTRDRQDIQLVGIIEPRQDLANRYAERFHLPHSLFASRLEELLARTNFQAVAVFTSTFEHSNVVQQCAVRGLHVMMEKPLAVSMAHAQAIAAAAREHKIHVIVNYETTWYCGNRAAFELLNEQHAIGEPRKFVVHDGHRGPKEIGCSPAFLEWLTDPVLNGGGALTDFGCYGADLVTWLLEGQRPTSVFAVTQQIKPEVYPKVEDEATIVITYPKAQAILQASWNWPFDRKDIEIYGQTGYVFVPRPNLLRVRQGTSAEVERTATELSGPQADPLSYLAAIVRGDIKPAGLSSLDVNMVVTEILDAARESARSGKRVDLPREPQKL